MTPEQQERNEVARTVVSRLVQDFLERGANMDRTSLAMLQLDRSDPDDLIAMIGVACGTIAALTEAFNLPKNWLETR